MGNLILLSFLIPLPPSELARRRTEFAVVQRGYAQTVCPHSVLGRMLGLGEKLE